jgi:hypothetical protein
MGTQGLYVRGLLKMSATGEGRRYLRHGRGRCYHWRMFNFGKPKTAGDWIVHIVGGIVAIFLVWWMLRMYVL